MSSFCTSYFEVFLYEHASSHCSLLWYANAIMTLCCGFHKILSLLPCTICVSVPFSKLHEHACPYCFSVGTKGCLQTNYGDVVKFIAVPSSTCVSIFWLVHVHYINMHLPLFFDVVCTQGHCLPTNYDDNVVTTLLEYCCQCC